MLEIDRIAPTYRPQGPNDGSQRWRRLLFCHWEIAVDILSSCVPSELEIDTFEGRAYVGLVPFQMRNIRPTWLPHRLAFNFLETNLRTYVVHNGRPGVYFFSLDASSWLAVQAARWGWSLPYFHASMTDGENDGLYYYGSSRCRQKDGVQVKFRIGDQLGPSLPETLQHFLLERYLMFMQCKNEIYVGQVHHEPYPVFSAHVESLQENLTQAAGIPLPNRLPDLAHYSPGVDVEVFGIQPANHTSVLLHDSDSRVT